MLLQICLFSLCIFFFHVSVPFMYLFSLFICSLYASAPFMHVFPLCICSLYVSVLLIYLFSLTSLHLKSQHGEVVELRRIPNKCIDFRIDVLQQLHRVHPLPSVECRE